jgi:hypothetical protein
MPAGTTPLASQTNLQAFIAPKLVSLKAVGTDFTQHHITI